MATITESERGIQMDKGMAVITMAHEILKMKGFIKNAFQGGDDRAMHFFAVKEGTLYDIDIIHDTREIMAKPDRGTFQGIWVAIGKMDDDLAGVIHNAG